MSPKVASAAAHHMAEAAKLLALSEEFRRFGGKHRPRYLQVSYRYAAAKMTRAARQHLNSLKFCLDTAENREIAVEQIHRLTAQLNSA